MCRRDGEGRKGTVPGERHHRRDVEALKCYPGSISSAGGSLSERSTTFILVGRSQARRTADFFVSQLVGGALNPKQVSINRGGICSCVLLSKNSNKRDNEPFFFKLLFSSE